MELKKAIGIARVIHEANCAWNADLGDPAPDPGFDVLEAWQKEFLLNRVQLIEGNLGLLDDEDLAIYIHQVWVDLMISRKWELAEKKDPAASPPTHPCLQDLRQLPPEQQKKDYLAINIVRALR